MYFIYEIPLHIAPNQSFSTKDVNYLNHSVSTRKYSNIIYNIALKVQHSTSEGLMSHISHNLTNPLEYNILLQLKSHIFNGMINIRFSTAMRLS